MSADVFDVCRFLYVFVVSLALAAPRPLLFADSDDVVMLTAQNFNELVHDSDTFWMVDFYSSWCGHCVNFAPAWKSFATDVKNWQSLVRIGAIACSSDDNLVPCRDHKITQYPTVMYFPPHSPETYVGPTYNEARKVINLRHSLINFMEKQDEGHLPQLEWLKPLKDMESIWQYASPSTKHVLVLFEDDNSYIGRELILDMLPYKDVLLRRMLKNDVTKFGIKSFPSLYLIKKDGTFMNIASQGSGREDFKEALMRHLNLPANVPTSSSTTKSSHKLEDAIQKVQAGEVEQPSDYHYVRVPEAVYYEDLLSAITHSLAHEVAAIPTIEGKHLEALKKYLQVLIKYLPMSENVISYIRKLNGWLEGVNKGVTGEDWLKEMHALQDSTSYIPFNTTYVGCRGSTPSYRGYPCSVWVLFHTMTVNSVLDHGRDATFDPQEVLLAMRGYITNFFGCSECIVHFNKGAKFIEERVKKADDGILYLWIMHNRANHFLHGDLTEDPMHIKVQFPPRSMCWDCYLSDKLEDGKPNWNEPNVVRFLKRFYAKDNIHRKPAERDADRSDLKARERPLLDVNEIGSWLNGNPRRKETHQPSDAGAKNTDDGSRSNYVNGIFGRIRQHERNTRRHGHVIASTDFTEYTFG